MTTSKPLLSIVVPTYNERDNLPLLLERIREALTEISYEVIIVDDDSPDGTWRLAEELAKTRYPWLRVVRRKGERGLATAVLRGFREARGEYVAVMDADLQHPPETLLEMVKNAVEKAADVVIASRYVSGGGVEGWSKARLLVSRTAGLLAYLLLPEARATTDPMSGFFLVRRGLLNNCITSLRPRGYKILLEILVKCKPAKVIDVPYVFRRRVFGKSKLGFKTIIDYLIHVLELNNYRIVKNMVVGSSGILVLYTVNKILSLLGIPKTLSYAVAIETSILSNFTFNNLWTFRGRTLKPLHRRLLEYHVAVAIGALVNYSVYQLLHVLLGIEELLSIITGVGLGFLANYTLSEHIVWKTMKHKPKQSKT